jgi:hypothetical protein
MENEKLILEINNALSNAASNNMAEGASELTEDDMKLLSALLKDKRYTNNIITSLIEFSKTSVGEVIDDIKKR